MFQKQSKKPGLSPGTLIHVGERMSDPTRIRVISYDKDNFEERTLHSIEDSFEYRNKASVTWINIDCLHEIQLIEKLGEFFGIHLLTLEDVLNTSQRPKLDEFDDYMFIVVRMLFYDEEEHEIISEQFSLVLGSSYVISFQERYGDVFDPLRERIRKAKGNIRKMGPDYLMYALIDSIVDNYFIILEKIGEDIELMEEELISDPGPQTLGKIHHFKTELILLRKAVWPLRDVINMLGRNDLELIHGKTSVFLRDLYDHTIQVIDTVEAYRDMVSGMMDVYLSSVSNKMNEVMKVLTIIATIFIPLTFIAGIYGMNFKFMPELEWHWGYFIVWAIMIGLGGLMLFYFRKKQWL